MNHTEVVGKVIGHYTKSCGLCAVIKFETAKGDPLQQTFQANNCEEHKRS